MVLLYTYLFKLYIFIYKQQDLLFHFFFFANGSRMFKILIISKSVYGWIKTE